MAYYQRHRLIGFLLFLFWTSLVTACSAYPQRISLPLSQTDSLATKETASPVPSLHLIAPIPSATTGSTPNNTPGLTAKATLMTPHLSETAAFSATTPAGTPATVTDEVADVWDDPAHEKDYLSRQTQLIVGERVLVLSEQGDWAQILAVEQPSHKDPRGYPGWVRKSSLASGWSQAGQFAVVMVPNAAGRSQPDNNAPVNQWLPLDARLRVHTINGDWLQLVLPSGQVTWLRLNAVRLTNDLATPYQLESFYNTASALVGIPYLWGGTGPNAMDCSGFIYRLFHAYGLTLARDADDQAQGGNPGSIQVLQRGDLIFTADQPGGAVTHVAMAWGNGQVIDADSPAGLTIHYLGSFLQTHFLVSVRRYLS